MSKFSQRSEQRLQECDDRLQELFHRVVDKFDCSVTCGYRGEEEQNKAFDAGMSKLKYPLSKHNKQPSMAVDVVPFPIDWKDIERFKRFGYFVLGVAHGMGIPIRWGADWNMDMNIADESFIDLPHYEIYQRG